MCWCCACTGCHLNLCLENVRVRNARFEERGEDHVGIPMDIGIKIECFEFAERFHASSFRCSKDIPSAAPYLSPRQFSGAAHFDASKADMWAIGQCFYWMMTGSLLYTADDAMFGDNAFRALQRGQLQQYLRTNDLLRSFKRRSFSLLSGLLLMDQTRRFDADAAVKHAWFASYWSQYGPSIERKFVNDVKRISLMAPKRVPSSNI